MEKALRTQRRHLDSSTALWTLSALALAACGGGGGGPTVTDPAAAGSQNRIDGTEGADRLTGTDAADSIYGYGGIDTLSGGGGMDTLTGGDGADNFVISATDFTDTFFINPADGDVITDFDPAEGDLITLNFNPSEWDLIILPDENSYIIWGNIIDVSGNSTGNTVIYAIQGLEVTTQTITLLMEGFDGDVVAEHFTKSDITILSEATIIEGTDNPETITVTDSEESINFIFGFGGNDTLNGGNDTLNGESVTNNWLDGGAGADTLNGGEGDWNSNLAFYDDSPSGVTINLSVTDADGYVHGSGGHAEGDRLKNIQDLWGSDYDDVLTGDAEFNNLWGGAGADTLYGGGGHDYLSGGDGHDDLYGGAAHDELDGGDGDDTLDGGDGDDYLSGGAGADMLDGGAGKDTANYADSSDGITVDLSGDKDDDGYITGTGGDAEGDRLKNIENIRGSHHNDTLTGDDGANVLEGLGSTDGPYDGNGDDYFYEHDGDDTLHGGGGNDYLYGHNGNDTLYGGVGDDRLYGHNGDDTLYGGVGNDLLDGHGGNDTLYGDDDNDTLIGGDGTDTLTGGDGADIFRIYSADGDIITDFTPNADTPENGDRIWLSSSFGNTVYWAKGDTTGDIYLYADADGAQLLAIVQNLTGDIAAAHFTNSRMTIGGKLNNFFEGTDTGETLTGTDISDYLYGFGGDDELHGGAGDDYLSGGDGNDELSGGNGSDRLTGGDGTDSFMISSADGDVITDFTPDATPENGDMITLPDGTTDIWWGAANTGSIYLYADQAATQILAVIRGFDGEITAAHFTNSGIIDVTEMSVIEGTSGSDYSLIGTHEADIIYGLAGLDYLYGEGGDDTLYGGDGNDGFVGGAGADTLDGGTGRDSAYYLDSSSGVTINLSETDTDGYGTGSGGDAQGDKLKNIELIAGSAHDDVLTGDAEANALFGLDGDDILYGLAGDDYLDGWDGDDVLYGGAGNDRLDGEGGNDTLYGGDGDDRLDGGFGDGGGDDILYGGDGNDILEGWTGNDRLDGGAGADTLDGGSGNDIFVLEVDGAADMTVADVIEYFSSGTDKLTFSTATNGKNLWFQNGVNAGVQNSGANDTVIYGDAAGTEIIVVLADYDGDITAADFENPDYVGTIYML